MVAVDPRAAFRLLKDVERWPNGATGQTTQGVARRLGSSELLPGLALQYGLTQLGEHLANLVEQIITVRALEGVNAGAVPALVLIIHRGRVARQVDGLNSRKEVGVEKERKR